MSRTSILVALTVVEIAILVAVLAVFLTALTKLLGRIAARLHSVTAGVQAVEGHLTILGAVPMVNRTLSDIAGALPVVAQGAVAKATRR